MKTPGVPALSLQQHNILDYVGGAAVALAPEALGLGEIPAAKNALRAVGLGTIGYSLLTDYDYAVAKVIPLGAHMITTLVTGVALMAAPFALGYHKRLSRKQLAFHLALGLGAIARVGFTPVRTEQQRLDRYAEELERRYRLAT